MAELATGRFAVVSPSTSMSGAGAFALRLCSAIDQIVMTYREERIRIHLTVGLATSEAGRMQTVSHLIGVALQRVASGQAAGGNRVIGDRGELTPEMMPAPPKPPVSIDQILQQLRASGADAELRKQLPDAIRTLLPLLELIESELPSGLPLAALARVVEAGSGIAVHKYE